MHSSQQSAQDIQHMGKQGIIQHLSKHSISVRFGLLISKQSLHSIWAITALQRILHESQAWHWLIFAWGHGISWLGSMGAKYAFASQPRNLQADEYVLKCHSLMIGCLFKRDSNKLFSTLSQGCPFNLVCPFNLARNQWFSILSIGCPSHRVSSKFFQFPCFQKDACSTKLWTKKFLHPSKRVSVQKDFEQIWSPAVALKAAILFLSKNFFHMWTNTNGKQCQDFCSISLHLQDGSSLFRYRQLKEIVPVWQDIMPPTVQNDQNLFHQCDCTNKMSLCSRQGNHNLPRFGVIAHGPHWLAD